MPVKPKSVDQYLDSGCGRCKFGGTPKCKVHTWSEELGTLRQILHETRLTEEIKWSCPCYTYKGKNILMMSALKESATVSFFRGAELRDPKNILEMPGENSRFARYIRFTDMNTVHTLKDVLLRYVQEAIEIESKVKKEPSTSAQPLEYPDELVQSFLDDPDFETAFTALTPGRQRGYLIFFTSAKQSKTKLARIEKSKPKILIGKGWNER